MMESVALRPDTRYSSSSVGVSPRSKAKENRLLTEKLEAARETLTVLGSFTSFRMTLSTREADTSTMELL